MNNVRAIRVDKKVTSARKTKVTAKVLMLELRKHLAMTLAPHLKEGVDAEKLVSELEGSVVALAIQKTSGYLGKMIQGLFQ